MTEAFLLGLALFFASTLLRAFPWPLWLASRKPLSCPTCLAGWGAIAAFVMMRGWEDWWQLGLLCSAAAGVAVLAEALRDWTRGGIPWPLPPGP